MYVCNLEVFNCSHHTFYNKFSIRTPSELLTIKMPTKQIIEIKVFWKRKTANQNKTAVVNRLALKHKLKIRCRAKKKSMTISEEIWKDFYFYYFF